MGMPCQFYGTSFFFLQPNAMLPCTFPGFFALSQLAFRCAISSRARDIAELGFTSHCDLAHQMHHVGRRGLAELAELAGGTAPSSARP